MPFPFTLPTTSSFSFSAHFESSSHSSLPISASTYRGVLRETLKKHKRLSAQAQASNLSSVLVSLESYIPHLLAIDAGLSNQAVAGEEVDILLKTTPIFEWRPTLSSSPVPGRERPRLKLQSLEFEIYFVLSTLAYTHTLISRTALQALYSTTTALPAPDQRTIAITTATKHLLLAASIHNYLSNRSSQLQPSPSSDISTPTFTALSSLALAEATLLAVLKDDPYPAAVAQERNKNDTEWMIKAPELPKVRAHLFARLCLAASEHAARASSLLLSSAGTSPPKGQGKLDDNLLRYVEDLRRAGKAKACRFLGIDADLGGQTGAGIAWVRAGLQELGVAVTVEEEKKKKKGSLGFGKLKREWSEKREDRKVEKGTAWGADAGKAEEARVLDSLEVKWVRENDTINTQPVPPLASLLATIPSGRDIHTVKPYNPPSLDATVMQSMRAPPEREDDYGAVEDSSDDDETGKKSTLPVGAFPGTSADYGGSGSYY